MMTNEDEPQAVPTSRAGPLIERLQSPWHNPLAAPVRHLLGGVLAGGALIGAFFGARTLLDEQPPHPDAWLTVEDQEALAAAISSVPVDAWVAGCLWKDRDATDILQVFSHPDGSLVQTWRWSGVREGLEVSLVSVEGQATESESFDEVSGPGYFCYVPEQRPALTRLRGAFRWTGGCRQATGCHGPGRAHSTIDASFRSISLVPIGPIFISRRIPPASTK